MGFNKETGLYELEDIAFVNTAEFTRTGQFYKKYGFYIDPRIDENSAEFKEFWDLEEDRRKNGMKMPGKLVTKVGPNGQKYQEIQEVHITGKHYGFLNYGRIAITKEGDDKELKFLTGNSVNHSRKVGKKQIDFPRFIDGQYHWFKAKELATKIGLNLVAAKARRKGFSYMEGFDCADEINMNQDITVLVTAFDMKYLTKGNQIMPMAKRYLDWFEDKTDFGRGFLKEEKDHFKLGFKKPGEGHKEYGYKSELIGLSLLNNPDAPAGKDAVLIKFEESGKNPLLKESLSITMSTTEDGSYTTGRIDIFGTGGTKDANWADFEEIYYNPKAYRCLAFDNIWDDGLKGTGAGFFYPQELGDPAHLDEHGNSLTEDSKRAFEIEKEEQKKILGQSAFVRWVSQRASCGKEAFSSGSDNIYPSAEILEQLSKVEHNPDYKFLPRIGELVRTERGIKLELNSSLAARGHKPHDPIFNFPLKSGQDVNGCYVEWISPYRDPGTGIIPKGLYRIWHDPYAHDKDTKDITIKDSLGATYVYERTNNITPGKGDYLVACYIGRPGRMDDYNENLLKVVEYWNGELMFENDRGDVKQFFGKNKKLHLLADEPDLEFEQTLKGKTGRGKGMHINEKRKGNAAIYLRDWLMEKRGKDIFGNERLNLHYIYDPALLRELLKWNNKGNFDRVSSLLVGMFDMKECFERAIKTPPKNDSNSFFNRPLFTK